MTSLILIGLSAARFWSCSQSAARFWSCSQSSAFCSGVLVQVLVVGTFTQKLLVPCSVTELRTSRRSRAGDRSRGSATTVNLTAPTFPVQAQRSGVAFGVKGPIWFRTKRPYTTSMDTPNKCPRVSHVCEGKACAR